MTCGDPRRPRTGRSACGPSRTRTRVRRAPRRSRAARTGRRSIARPERHPERGAGSGDSTCRPPTRSRRPRRRRRRGPGTRPARHLRGRRSRAAAGRSRAAGCAGCRSPRRRSSRRARRRSRAARARRRAERDARCGRPDGVDPRLHRPGAAGGGVDGDVTAPEDGLEPRRSLELRQSRGRVGAAFERTDEHEVDVVPVEQPLAGREVRGLEHLPHVERAALDRRRAGGPAGTGGTPSRAPSAGPCASTPVRTRHRAGPAPRARPARRPPRGSASGRPRVPTGWRSRRYALPSRVGLGALARGAREGTRRVPCRS